MSTAQRTERDASIADAGKRHLMEIRAKRALTVAITNESWGKAMTHRMREAFAEYMRRFHLDISEVDNLGGKPYRNGNYFKRRVAEMRSRGLVEWSEGEYIGTDARLDALQAAGDEWATAENIRRARLRIMWAVPADASHAYVVRIKLKSDGKPLEGCDWITPQRTKRVKDWDNRVFKGFKDVPADPVGAEEPEKTVVTRAWRRAGLLAAAEIPELHSEERVMDLAAEEVEAEIEEIAEAEEQHEEATKIVPKALNASPPDDPYGLGTAKRPEPEHVAAKPLTDEELDERRFADE